MHLSNIAATAIVAAASLAVAQNLPQCANPAIEASITKTSCELTDYKCICSSSGFIDAVKSLIESDCSASDQALTLQYAQSTCEAAGASLGDDNDSSSAAPPAATASTSSAEPTATSSVPAGSTLAAVPTSTPAPYPVGNGTTGGLNGTNSTTAPFLGGASAQSSGLASLAALLASAALSVLFL